MKRFLLILGAMLSVIVLSATMSYLVIRSQGYVRFVSAPRPDNRDYGYLEINGNEYRQLYTTTEVIDNHVPPGSHYHRIDLRVGK